MVVVMPTKLINPQSFIRISAAFSKKSDYNPLSFISPDSWYCGITV